MFSVFNDYNIIDLSEDIYPVVFKANNQYIWGKHVRKFEARQYESAQDHSLMHFVDAEIHIGTHVECPAHLTDGGKSPADLPIGTYMGEAIVLKFDGISLEPEHFAEVKKGDIVLLYSDKKNCWITPSAAKCLLDKGIKMLGVQGVAPDDPKAYQLDSGVRPETHEYLLGNDIPIVEKLINLDKITKPRVYFIGLPLKIHYIDSSWIRAIAFEQKF